MVTIKDISKRCGVSPATVSKALNGYDDVSPKTLERIRKAADELHYMPNAAARLLKTNRSNNIGVVFEDETLSGLTHDYFSAILNSAKLELEKHGYDITFIGQKVGGSSFLEHVRYRKCDGVLIANVDFSADSVQELIRSEIPTITIDYVFDNVSSVLSDNVEGGYLLTKYLLDAGHEKIAFIHGEMTSVTSKRLSGFYKAFSEYGLEVPTEYVVEGRYHDAKVSSELTKKLMELETPPTAILYPDDYAYIGGMNELEKMGIRIPDDISVVGYDGINLSQVIRPRLTTYRQDTDSIGRESARKLIEIIEQGKSAVAEQIMVSGQLVEGKSVKRYKA